MMLRRQNMFRLKCRSTKNRGFSSITLGYLTDVSLKLCCVVFKDYQPAITDFSRQAQMLHIVICDALFSFIGVKYLNGERCERSI
jgi:hypothetical protein